MANFADIIKIAPMFVFCQNRNYFKRLVIRFIIKKLAIMYYNAIYICISWYNRSCWFPVKKCWCQQNSKGESHDLFIFWIFFR